jgi:hypothetical protein
MTRIKQEAIGRDLQRDRVGPFACGKSVQVGIVRSEERSADGATRRGSISLPGQGGARPRRGRIRGADHLPWVT